MSNKNNILDSTKNWVMRHKKEILGGCLLIAGVALIWFSKEIILNVIFFMVGAILLYLGFRMLNVTVVTKFIDKQINRFFNTK